MIDRLELVKPQFAPPLDDQFHPAVLARRTFEGAATAVSVPLVFGLQREDGNLSRFETRVFPEDHPLAEDNLYYAERMFKFLLWQRGGGIIYIGGPRSVGGYLQSCYAPGGRRSFDYRFMSEQVYGPSFHIELCEASQVPPAHDIGRELGRPLGGCRIGFDLGASDPKVRD